MPCSKFPLEGKRRCRLHGGLSTGPKTVAGRAAVSAANIKHGRYKNWRLIRHYLLYPNPYPKASQLRKRWYGSPAFPSLLALVGVLTVRSNWPIYVEEFALARKIAGYAASWQTLVDAAGVTAFETKYAERGQRLLEMVCDLLQPLA